MARSQSSLKLWPSSRSCIWRDETLIHALRLRVANAALKVSPQNQRDLGMVASLTNTICLAAKGVCLIHFLFGTVYFFNATKAGRRSHVGQRGSE
jgi:hypothetical protein